MICSQRRLTKNRRYILLVIAVASIVVTKYLYSNTPSNTRVGDREINVHLLHNVHYNTNGKSVVEQTNHCKIQSEDKFVLKYLSGGYVFKETGVSYSVNGSLTTSLVYSFSPDVEKRVSRMFPDPLVHQQTFLANAPAFTWHHGELVAVLRIWLLKEQYYETNSWPDNNFHDNYLYIQKFDSDFNKITNGSILGIPSNKNWKIGDGPLEPRLFKHRSKLYISFNIAMMFGEGKALDQTVLWDVKDEVLMLPKLKNSPIVPKTTENGVVRDKHWIPFNMKDELYFVHTFDPFRVMHCDLTSAFSCEFVINEGEKLSFDDYNIHLRGGTPFEVYDYPYFISVGHSTLFKTFKEDKKRTVRYYTANIIIMCVEPQPRIVYVGDGIRLHRQILHSVPIVRKRYIEDPFIFPVGIVLEDMDTMYLGVHINDYSSVALRIRGLSNIVPRVITLDKRQNAQKGPPVGSLHAFIRSSAEYITGWRFKTNTKRF